MSGDIAGRADKSQVAARGVLLLLSAAALCVLISGATRAGQGRVSSQGATVTAERYDIDVSFQPERGFLHARAKVTLRAEKEVTAVELELNPHLRILEVTDAQGGKLEFDRSGRLGSPKLSVRLAEPLPAGDTAQSFALTFLYEGVLPAKPLDYITKDGILLRDESRWYPAVDLSAFTLNDIAIRLPYRWKTIASGELQDNAASEDGNVEHWRVTRPVSSRAIAAYPWGVAFCTLTVGDRQHAPPITHSVESCLPPPLGKNGKRPDLEAYHRSNRRMDALKPRQSAPLRIQPTQPKAEASISSEVFNLLTRYGDIVGPKPDETRLTIVQGFPGQRGAIGYSAPGFLVVSEDVVKYHDYSGYAPEFLPHEIAHQWFPIEVTLERQEDGWLAESLAEYLAWRYLQETNPEQARLLVARAMRDALAPEPLRPLALGLKLFALDDASVVRETLYQRGMLVWRTLETVIDRERVDRALSEYSKRFAGRSASIADFRKICEEISGRNLGWFFDYFLSGTEIPEIQFRRTPSSAPNEVAGEIVVKNVPPEFSVRVEMRVETLGGPVEHSVATRGEVTPFTVTTTQPVTRVTLDPNLRILRWTEAARRNREQRALLASLGDLERAGQFTRGAQICEKALEMDPGNLAWNEQQIRFALGRLHYRQGQFSAASAEFGKMLELGSLDSMARDFNWAWAHVYRARIAQRRGNRSAAREEASRGLALKSPALETPVKWPEAPGRPMTASQELRALLH